MWFISKRILPMNVIIRAYSDELTQVSDHRDTISGVRSVDNRNALTANGLQNLKQSVQCVMRGYAYRNDLTNSMLQECHGKK